MTAYDTVVGADSPAQYLKLLDPSGATAADSSGNARPGTYVAAPSLAQPGLLPCDVPAGGETCVLLNGTTQWVSVPNAAWQQTAAATWEAWVQLTGTWTNQFMWGQDNTTTNNRRVQLATNSASIWVSSFFNGSTQFTTYVGAQVPIIGRKVHLVQTHDGTVGRFYVNGVEVAQTASGALNTATVTDLFYWGAIHAGSGMKGNIEKVAIYPAALSAARVLAHYQAGTNPWADAFASAGTLDESWLSDRAGIGGTGLDISGYTTEASEPGSLAKTAWAIVTPSTSGNLTIDTTGSAFTATVNLYTGSALGSLALVATGTTTLTAALTAGIAYRVQVGGAGGLLNYSFKFVSTGAQQGGSPVSGVLPWPLTGWVFKGHGSKAADTTSVA